MSITNGYCTLEQIKTELGLDDELDSTLLELSVAAASRQIDGQCGRRFWQDATAVTRTYDADSSGLVEVDDISTTVGLIVKVDYDGTGGYATTLTVGTDYLVAPVNAAAAAPVRPYTELQMVGTSNAYFPTGWSRPGVQVTAKFGWPAVPDDITKACIVQALQLYKSKDALFGAVEFGDGGGGMRVRSALNPIAIALISPYAKARCA